MPASKAGALPLGDAPPKSMDSIITGQKQLLLGALITCQIDNAIVQNAQTYVF
jgi:hypothetical protein